MITKKVINLDMMTIMKTRIMNELMKKKQYLRIDEGDLPDKIKRYPQDSQDKPQFYALIEKEYENYYDLCFSEDVTIEDLKIISNSFKECVMKVTNKLSWEEAKGFHYFNNNEKGLSVGKVFRLPNGKYYSSKAIGIELTLNPKDRVYSEDYCEEDKHENLEVTTIAASNNDKQQGTKANNHGDLKDSSANKIKDNKPIDENTDNLLSDTVRGCNSDKNINENTGKGNEQQLKNCNIKESIQKVPNNYNQPDSNANEFDSKQYLMSGREGDSFFYEGSTSDASGASFKIEFESSSMKGLYSLIVDMNNLRTINPGFRREVIKIENNGTTIREASAFTIVNKGEAHFSKEDSVWIVDKPLVIKLLK